MYIQNGILEGNARGAAGKGSGTKQRPVRLSHGSLRAVPGQVSHELAERPARELVQRPEGQTLLRRNCARHHRKRPVKWQGRVQLKYIIICYNTYHIYTYNKRNVSISAKKLRILTLYLYDLSESNISTLR